MRCERCGSDQLETSDVSLRDDAVVVDGYCMDCEGGAWYFTSTFKLSETTSHLEEWEEEDET